MAPVLLASRIAQLIGELRPEDALQCEDLWAALRSFVNRADNETRELFTTYLIGEGEPYSARKKRRASKLSSNDSILSLAEILYREVQILLRDNSIWSTARPSCQVSTGSRLNRVVTELTRLDSSSRLAEAARRLVLVFVDYEIRRLEPDVERMLDENGRTERSSSAAKRAFVQETDLKESEIDAMLRSLRPYRHIARKSNGLGLLLLLGPQNRYLWERRTSLHTIDEVLELCEAKGFGVAAAAETLQSYALAMVESIFKNYTKSPSTAELRCSGHIFSAHFDQDSVSRLESGNALDALAAAAQQIDTRNGAGLPSHGCLPLGHQTPELWQMPNAQPVNGVILPDNVSEDRRVEPTNVPSTNTSNPIESFDTQWDLWLNIHTDPTLQNCEPTRDLEPSSGMNMISTYTEDGPNTLSGAEMNLSNPLEGEEWRDWVHIHALSVHSET